MRIKKFYILVLTITLGGFCFHSTSYASKGDRFTVVIDAGHGGHDPGAIGSFSREKNINLKVALQVGSLIDRNCNDVKVIYTRKSDVFIPLDKRADIANKAQADLFISIHTNSLPKGKIARGAETYTLGMARAKENLEVAKKENSVILVEKNYKERYAGFNPNSAESYVIFEFMQDKYMAQSVNIAKLMQKQFGNSAGRIDKGVHQAGFLVLRATSMPSILIELGYISTLDEENYLNSDNGIASMSRCIYKAFVKYKEEQTGKKTVRISQEETDKDEKTVGTSQKERDTDESAETDKPDSIEKPSTPPQPAIRENPVDTPVISNKSIKVGKRRTTNKLLQEKQEDRSTTETNVTDQDKPVFKIQFLLSKNKLKDNDPRLKEEDVDFYIENGTYKYTIGNSNDYNKILRIKKLISLKYKDAFIIAFKGNEKMNVHEAIQLFKKNR